MITSALCSMQSIHFLWKLNTGSRPKFIRILTILRLWLAILFQMNVYGYEGGNILVSTFFLPAQLWRYGTCRSMVDLVYPNRSDNRVQYREIQKSASVTVKNLGSWSWNQQPWLYRGWYMYFSEFSMFNE